MRLDSLDFFLVVMSRPFLKAEHSHLIVKE